MRWRTAVGLTVAVALVSVVGCARGVYHRVRPGENLYRIGKAYGIPFKRLAAINHLSDPSRLQVGQRLFIPSARRTLPVNVITPQSANVRRPRGSNNSAPGRVLDWPVRGGTVTSRFGQRGRSFHDGIDIAAPVGTPVHAAQAGRVIYSDVLRGYGNVIIVRHEEGLATVYAHNHRNLVRDGQRVQRGEVIGSVGESGRTSGANLHFEVRRDNVAQNPLDFLPRSERVAGPGAAAGHGG